MSDQHPPYPGDNSGDNSGEQSSGGQEYPGQQPYYGAQQPYPGQQPYTGQPGAGGQQYPPPGQAWGAVPPKHPSATTSMVLGIIGLVSVVACLGVGLVLSPFAWAMGSKAVREIDANPTLYSGRSEASTGRITGIIGTILLILGVIVMALFITLVVIGASSGEWESDTSYTSLTSLF